MQSGISQFIRTLEHSLVHNEFISLSLGNYQGQEQDLKKVRIKKVRIKKKDKLSFVYRYKTKDITKNYLISESIEHIHAALQKREFGFARLETINKDVEFQFTKNGSAKLKETATPTKEIPNTQHDKQKNRKIKAKGQQYLYDLKITDQKGQIRPHGQDKFRQINHYIEILSSLLKELPKKDRLNIVDMGSGKGYLTFALYDYLNNELYRPSTITGVEFRKDLVDLCNTIASNAGFDKLHFKEGSIENYKSEAPLDVLIALHACDTATDDAIFQGIQANAALIVVAPCCHKQIRKEIQKNKTSNATDFMTKHGIFLERQAEMITDGLRALFLEQAGYTTKVFEFIATEHTPKNILIVGEKKKNVKSSPANISAEIAQTKTYFGIREHYLETLLKTTER